MTINLGFILFITNYEDHAIVSARPTLIIEYNVP